GTPIGIADRIPKWKHSMTAAATIPAVVPWPKNRTIGTKPSIAVEAWANRRDGQPGRRSSGTLLKNRRLSQRGRSTGLLLIIVEMTNGKCLVSFDVAAPSQITRHTSLAARIMSTVATPANRNATVNDPYTSPRAARKMTLSRRPSTPRTPTTHHLCHIGSTPTAVPNAGPGPVPSENSAITSITTNAPYSAASKGVRVV